MEPSTPEILFIDEVAERCRVSVATINRWLRQWGVHVKKDRYLQTIDSILSTAKSIGSPIVNHAGIVYYWTGTHYAPLTESTVRFLLKAAASRRGLPPSVFRDYEFVDKIQKQFLYDTESSNKVEEPDGTYINLLNGTLLDAVKFLLERGAKVNICDIEDGRTPLHYAALRGEVKIMRVLLDAGADGTVRDDNGKMASHYTKKGYPVAMALPKKRKESRETADVRHEIESIITKHERKTLTQRLKQSMELLQLTLQQLEQRIDQELEQNPMLELGVESSGEAEERSHESDTVAAALVPDIVVEKDETGKYTVRLEDGRALQLRISKYYENLLEKQETDEETKAYIRKKVGAARWFLDAIEQRRGTLLKISQAMVDEQTEFFEKGQQALKPLSIQQIANITGMHATTVARACEEMWVSSPQGVFLLCRLFVGESATTDEETEPTE